MISIQTSESVPNQSVTRKPVAKLQPKKTATEAAVTTGTFLTKIVTFFREKH